MTVDYLSALNSSGSGLNITQIVDSLVEAEQAPKENVIQTKIDDKTTSISAIGEVKSALSTLSSSLESLTGNTSLKVSSNSTSITASIVNPAKAVSINSSISVSTLAAGQTLAFENYSSNTSLVGAGTLTLERGDWSSGSFVASSTIASDTLTVLSTDTLESLKDKINTLNYGVTASVIGVGDDTYTLILKSGEGKENALRITASENPSGSGLSAIDNTTTNGSKQKVAGTDASISVDGISLTRSTNNINDLFDGYEINLISTTSSAANISSNVDVSLATTNIQSFVDAVNKARLILTSKTFRGSSTESAGELSDDPVIKNIREQVERLTSTVLDGFGANGVYVSNLGIQTERDGQLTLNTTVLENELKNNPSSLDAVFNSMYSSTSSLLTVSGPTSRTPKAGSYAFAMTAYISGNINGLKSNDTTPGVTSSNNTIQLTVDGTTSGTVTISNAEYSSEAALATAIQTAVNSDSTLSAAGKSVRVTHSNGSYNIASASTGSSTSIVLNSIGSNLNGFLKMSGSADDDSISTSQNGTASTALIINGNSSVPLDADGLVSNGSTSGSGTLSINGALSSEAANGINSFINVASSSNNSSVTFTINGTNIDGTSLTETVTGVNNNTVSTTNIFATVTSITTNATSSAINIGNTPAIVSSSGQRASVTSAGGDESSNSFTIIGTDLSGNSQTEVVIGPAANATAFGSKTFKTITSITPTSNTTSSIKIGTTSNGITTAGVTGSATFQNIAMSADPENKTFTVTSGDGAGIKVKYSGLGSDATVYFGQSMIEKISAYLTDILDSSTGQIAIREKTISSEMTEQNALLLDLKTQMESTRARYIQQFTVMEQSVTSLKSTGEYLTNLFEAMNKDN